MAVRQHIAGPAARAGMALVNEDSELGPGSTLARPGGANLGFRFEFDHDLRVILMFVYYRA